KRFKIGRGYNDTMMNDPEFFDPAQVLGVNSDSKKFDELGRDFEITLKRSGWLVLAGHEMAAVNAFQTTMFGTIEAIVRYCKENNVWLDTVDRVATHVLTARQ